MLFKDYHIPQIRSGSKTVTRREWADNYSGPNPGTVVAATTDLFVPDEEADCYIRITDVYDQPLGEMTDADAQREGDYETLAAFREGYAEVYGESAWDPEKIVTVVEFEYVGRERPAEDVDGETHVDDGLWIPPNLREFDQQIVVKTPRSTVQHYGKQPLDPYYGMVTEHDFGPTERFVDPRNPDLAPDRVRIKPRGEEPVTLAVTNVGVDDVK